jgi:hypothetical protein
VTLNDDEMKVLNVGQEVVLGYGEDVFKGKIVSILIDGKQHTQYKVRWWAGRDRKEQWLEPFELRTDHVTQVVKIGFGNGDFSR